MTSRLQTLEQAVRQALGERVRGLTVALGEITVTVAAKDLTEAMALLRDGDGLRFTQLADLCGVDYQAHAGGAGEGQRFAVVYHLLSMELNQRVRVRAYCADDDFPAVDSVVGIWPSANWFEREAFDLFGIVFPVHPDLRRLLTDYGFVGHPFRKDFPLSGHVEMRYDPDQQRVIYQPVSIEPREIVPRVTREAHYGDVE
jgi:NADH-quinone oxidoreductase subunit C